MKKLAAVLCVFGLLLCMTACGKADEAQAQADALGRELAKTLEKLNEAETKAAELESELAAAQEHKAALQDDLSGLWAKYYDVCDELKAAQESKWSSIVCSIGEKDMNGAILRSDRLYMDPWTDAELKDLREGQYVEIIMKAQVMDAVTGEVADWYLLTWKALAAPGTPFTDFAWAPADALEEYTYENMKEIVGPVSLRAGTVIYDDEALSVVSQYPPSETANFTVQDLGNGVCAIGAAGYGVPFYVRSSDVVYPQP